MHWTTRKRSCQLRHCKQGYNYFADNIDKYYKLLYSVYCHCLPVKWSIGLRRRDIASTGTGILNRFTYEDSIGKTTRDYVEGMTILETSRLLLRHLLPNDLDCLWELYCDSEVIKYIPDAPRTYWAAKAELEWFMNGHPEHPELGLWATIHKETGRFIGRCGLLPWTIDGQYEVEVAYLIERAYWGQGLGTEAARAIRDYGFEQLGLSRLVCLVDSENLASIKVAKKIGMRFEEEGRDDKGPFLLFSRNKQSIIG